ncbi:hypothetical protein [Streptomyces sp. NPDC059063]|uniref:hypothetical protein n=1 Tax=unclassified Streptomyces TaxID=2593676 RepID=UPI0036CD6745
MTVTLTLRKQGGVHALDASASIGSLDATATLEFGRAMRTGTITSGGRALPIAAHGPHRTAVTVGGGSRPVLRLALDDAFVPGPAEQVRWSVFPHRRPRNASLESDRGRLDFTVPQHGKQVTVEVTGDWDQLDTVALAGCFALLSMRRGHTYRALTVLAVTGGPHPK